MDTILLVDSDQEFLQTASSRLSQLETIRIVQIAESGEDAIRQVEALKPDIVCISISMPGMSGIEAARRIKTAGNAPFVVMLACRDSIAQRCHATAAGANAFIQKNRFDVEMPGVLDALRESKDIQQPKRRLSGRAASKYRVA